MSQVTRATIDDLYRVKGKAELIAGKIIRFPPTGYLSARIRGEIQTSLDDYANKLGRGEAFGSTIAYIVPELRSGRQSFSPGASYFVGPFPENPMAFLEGPPTFAVEVRNGDEAATEIEAKRADHFEAGTLVVWDVDPVAEVIRCYRADAPDVSTEFHRGDDANAEPAVPDWRVSVDELFA